MVLKKSQRVISFMLALIFALALSATFCVENAGAVADGEWTYDIEANGANITLAPIRLSQSLQRSATPRFTRSPLSAPTTSRTGSLPSRSQTVSLN